MCVKNATSAPNIILSSSLGVGIRIVTGKEDILDRKERKREEKKGKEKKENQNPQ
jgi:hypothetical protein